MKFKNFWKQGTCLPQAFKIPEVQSQFIKQTWDKCPTLGAVKRANLFYNLPIYCEFKNKVWVPD